MTIGEIEANLPNGFHDATLNNIFIDYDTQRVVLSIEVNIGSPEDDNENFRTGKLTISGVLFCAIEPPDPKYAFQKAKGIWIADSGTVTSSMKNAYMIEHLPKGVFFHYFFINEWNSFIFVAARDAVFEWGN